MAVAFQTATIAGGNTASLVCNIPANTATGDVIFAAWGARATCIMTPAAGWVVIASATAGGATPTHYLLYLVIGGVVPTSCTFAMSGAGNQAVGMSRYSGVNTASIIDSDTQVLNGNSTSPISSCVITGTASAMLINSIADAAITAVASAPSAMVEAWQTTTGAIVNEAHVIQGTPGTSITYRADIATSTRWTDFLTSLQPTVAAGGTPTPPHYMRPIGFL